MSAGKTAGRKTLRVQMLGECSVLLDGQPLDCFGSAHSKTMRLFILLAYYGIQGISRQEVLEILYGDTDTSNDAGNLRAVAFRLRKQMVQAGILSEKATISDKGTFRWNQDQVKVEIDAKEFEAAARRALDAGNLSEKETGTAQTHGGCRKTEQLEWLAELLKEACRMYTGEFLPDMASELWAAERQVACQNLFFACLRRYVEVLTQLGKHEEILDEIPKVLLLYPYEEWYLAELDALIAMEKWKDAMEAYEEAAKSLMNNMGIHPTKALLRRSNMINERMRGSTRSLLDIRSELEEKEYESGAYFCSYTCFVSAYRREVRRIERSGQSMYLMMCTLTEKGQKNGFGERNESFDNAMEGLGDVIRESLRRGDSYTRYGANQYLMLLISLKQEDCSIVSGRIERNFNKLPGTRKYQLNHYIEAVVQQERTSEKQAAPIKFGGKSWE